MHTIPTNIPDILLVIPEIYEDNRGFFLETYHKMRFSEAGISANFLQDNHSGSWRGTLRGLHYQIKQPQGKLVRAIKGEIFDVAVDLRRSSPTFGKWSGTILSANNRHQLWIPEGFAHGFYVVSAWAELTYKVTNYYAPEWERTLLWNDPKIGIDWPLITDYPVTLNTKDAHGLPIDQAELFD